MSTMTSGPTHQKTRKKRRQAARRLKRNAMQNLLVLKGWVPVQLNAQYGIWHHDTNRIVMRKWEAEKLPPPSAFPYPMPHLHPTRYSMPKGRWKFECIQLSTPFNGAQVDWNDIQLRWVHALRNAAIMTGWL